MVLRCLSINSGICESYIIAGSTHTLVEAMKLAQRTTGVPASREVSPAMIKAAAAVMGVAEKVAPVPDEYGTKFLRISAGIAYIGSNAKARRELAYNPAL